MTDEELKRLRELADAATGGPWTFARAETKEGTAYQHICAGPVAVADTWHADSITVLGYGPLAGHLKARPGKAADALFIAAARTAIPALLDEVERLRSANAVILANAVRALTDER